MGFIRSKKEELTGYQESAPFNKNIRLGCDFVMVYGNDPSLPDRINEYREQGYVIHLMTGMAWGDYQDYLYGRWDGETHWDEAQKNQHGEIVAHGIDIPYMVPTISFSNYLISCLKGAIDHGVEAIHLEEPEFWDKSGYSDAFKQEYLAYYNEEWQDPDESLIGRYNGAKLKAYLYTRAIDRITSELKIYGLRKHKKLIRFYIPTHSLINYAQWKIVSPESKLINISSLDGYIAQVWTGTSRSVNMYRGIKKERTFETAYLEYGVMEELVRGTDKRMWFLHDPIEDNGNLSWDDYVANYKRIVIASLLHPDVSRYEICPWPNRVFNGQYPQKSSNKKGISESYKTLLNNMIQTLGNMDQANNISDTQSKVGVLISDSAQYQRTLPKKWNQSGYSSSEQAEIEFLTDDCFPGFYGMALPLLKRGIGVAPVLMENLVMQPSNLDTFKILTFSYEFMKPEEPTVNILLSDWIKRGGILVYIGKDDDPYNQVPGWWNTGDFRYKSPFQHLLSVLKLPVNVNGEQVIGKGKLIIIPQSPGTLCSSITHIDNYIEQINQEFLALNINVQPKNYLQCQRGPYTIVQVMNDSITNEPRKLAGMYVDLFEPTLPLVINPEIPCGQGALLYDLKKAPDLDQEIIIGSTGRIETLEIINNGFFIGVSTTQNVSNYIRLFWPTECHYVVGTDDEGTDLRIEATWDEASQTLLLCFEGNGGLVHIAEMPPKINDDIEEWNNEDI